MDGVSFSPVSSFSLQHQAGNQICHYPTWLACYSNTTCHMCFPLRVLLQLEYLEKSNVKRR